MNDKTTSRTTIYAAGEAHQRLDVLMDQAIDHRDEPVLIQRPGKEPVALVVAAELANWLETAVFPGKYIENEDAGDAERDRLASILDGLETDYLLCSVENAQRLREASDRAAAGKGESLSVEQLRSRFGLEESQ